MRGHIGQRGKSFYVSIYGGVDPETGKQQRHFRSFKQREQAEHYLARLVDRRMSGELLPNRKVTCGLFFERWLEHYAKNRVAPTTLSSYQDIVHVHLRPALANTALARLMPHHLMEYLNKKHSDGLSGTTCLYHYRLLHKILNDAVFWGRRCSASNVSSSRDAANKIIESLKGAGIDAAFVPAAASGFSGFVLGDEVDEFLSR